LEKQKLTEGGSQEIIDAWKAQAKTMSPTMIEAFVKHLDVDYEHDVGTLIHAVAAGALAGAWAVMNEHAVSNADPGTQSHIAGGAMWEFIRGWGFEENHVGLRLVNYDNMLYPHYEPSFEKTITAKTFKQLQEGAQALLDMDHEHPVAPEVEAHWCSIAGGVVPFGYRIRTEKDEAP
jgi:hypothetical protein